MSSKAAHLELAGDLSEDGFLNCLKRFVSRRELCTDIFSDATNFVGANNEIKYISECAKSENIHNFLTENKID